MTGNHTQVGRQLWSPLLHCVCLTGAPHPAPWWKFSFMRKPKSQPKVLHEIPAESVSNSTSGQHGSAGGAEVDSQLEARLERIVDKTTGTKGRHVKVSHSGRYKEQKRVRTTLTENQEMFRGENPATDENQRVRK
uniref:Proline rich 15 like a n=1 Tax=Cynoglossus semilaevis TaxID=244447 RepID=A0A3P8W5V7_CYNSE